MYYVYCLNLESNREESCGVFDTRRSAICKIASLYNLDRDYDMLGRYYYFMRQH